MSFLLFPHRPWHPITAALAVAAMFSSCAYEGLTLEQIVVASSSIPCAADDACVDPCHSVSACVDGFCAYGEADLDADGDGLIDISCDGGIDCYDAPDLADCADCFVGNTALDTCDGLDQNCNGTIDEHSEKIWYHDGDGDGAVDMSQASRECSAPQADMGTWLESGAPIDCNDDRNECGSMCMPGLREALDSHNCRDGFDNDCNGLTDAEEAACRYPNTPPTADLVVTNRAAAIGEEQFFDGTRSRDGEDSHAQLSFEWDFDSDGTVDAEGSTVWHTYGEVGSHDVSLTVRDGGGLFASRTQRVVVADAQDIYVPRDFASLATALAGITPAIVLIPGDQVYDMSTTLHVNGSGGTPRTIVAQPGAVFVWNPDVFLEDCVLVEGNEVTLIGLQIEQCPGDALDIEGNNNRVFDVSIRGAAYSGIDIDGDDNIVGPGNHVSAVHEICIEASGSRNEIRGNTLARCEDAGIRLAAGRDGPARFGWVTRNVIIDSEKTAVLISNYHRNDITNVTVAYNTIWTSWRYGVKVQSAGLSGVDHIIVENIAVGINGTFFASATPGPGITMARNLLFEVGLNTISGQSCETYWHDVCDTSELTCVDTTGACPYPNPQRDGDPEFRDAYHGDFRLMPSSPCVDVGQQLQGRPDDALGNAPDCGGVESY